RWHLDRLIAATSGDNSLYALRGQVLAELGRWSEADADFARAAATGRDIIPWFDHALLRLHLGDPEGYRSTCAQMLKKFEGSKAPNTLRWVVIMGGLAPDAVADPARLVRAAERSAALNKDKRQNDAFVGRALYRAGRYKEAVKQ